MNARTVCQNCEQWQHPGRNGYADCLHECRARGFEPMPKPGTPRTCKGCRGTGEDTCRSCAGRRGKMALTDYSCQDQAHASDAVCPACLGTGQVTDRITVQDALCDAETLVPYLKPRVAAVLDRGQDAMYSLGLAIYWARAYQSEHYDAQAEIKGRQRGRVAFVACPGLRG